ncbi:TGF-beta receptor type-2-like [Anneissia japonica]|uniref:TGF-beta receptor type-2-like n=1 Tax=Anneissia japonica TaxID=1529436 RepID=UPI001425B82B|nr:TGF-beta receptor type-2-like [Anneissia japonica]
MNSSYQRIYPFLIVTVLLVCVVEFSNCLWCPTCTGGAGEDVVCKKLADGRNQCHVVCPSVECEMDSECFLLTKFHDNDTVVEGSLLAGCFPVDTTDELYVKQNKKCEGTLEEDFNCQCYVSNCTSNFTVNPENYDPSKNDGSGKETNSSTESTTSNKNLRTTYKETTYKKNQGQNIIKYVVGGIVAGILLILIVLSLFGMAVAKQRRRLMDDYKHGRPSSNAESTSVDITSEGSDQKIIGADTPPESPIHDYNQNMKITLDYIIGRGRYGAVWKAEWKQRDEIKDVAVKVFHTYDSTSWNVEKDLFTDASVSLSHENVVNFISAEERRQTYQRLWIVTSFYENGCVMNYIKMNTLDWEQFCLMGLTLCRGIAHLHSDFSPNGLRKVPIAHRDLKSSNVLVKADGSCAIADFGLAVRLDPNSSTDDMANNGQVGTPRYMAPEALECKVNLRDIEAFKQMDAYSMALILWEIAMRCDVTGYAHEHQLPFADKIPGHPSMEKMKTMVAYSRLRPPIPEDWSTVTGMNIVSATIQDGWDDDPEARLSASCVEVRFYDLSTFINGRQLVEDTPSSPVTVV